MRMKHSMSYIKCKYCGQNYLAWKTYEDDPIIVPAEDRICLDCEEFGDQTIPKNKQMREDFYSLRISHRKIPKYVNDKKLFIKEYDKWYAVLRPKYWDDPAYDWEFPEIYSDKPFDAD